MKRNLVILALAAVIIFALLTQGCTWGCVATAWLPAITGDNSGGAIVTYGIYEDGDRNAYIQRVDAEGIKLWGEEGTLLGVSIHSPLIASDGFGNAIAAWWQEDDIVAQKINSEGHMLWQKEGAPIFTDLKGFYWKKIVNDSFGGAIFCLSVGGNGKNLYVQKVDSEGKLLWIKAGKSVCLEASVEDMPFSFDIASDNSGGAIIVWERRSGGIFVQRIGSEGNVLWVEGGVKLSSTPNVYRPAVIGDGSGRAIVVWEHFEENEEGQQMSSIYAQRVDAEGNIQWQQGGLPVLSSSQSLIGDPRIVTDGSGGAIIAGTTIMDLYAQRIDSEGNIQWSENGVKILENESPLNIFYNVIADDPGGAIVVFAKISTNARDPRGLSYVQKLDAMGRKQWGPDGTLVSAESAGTRISDDGFGGAVVLCWPYAQKINAQGEQMWGEKGVLLSRKDTF